MRNEYDKILKFVNSVCSLNSLYFYIFCEIFYNKKTKNSTVCQVFHINLAPLQVSNWN